MFGTEVVCGRWRQNQNKNQNQNQNLNALESFRPSVQSDNLKKREAVLKKKKNSEKES